MKHFFRIHGSDCDSLISDEGPAIRYGIKQLEEEGIFSGMSSGGSVATAIKIANSIDKGVVVAIVCDRGDRYLSSDIYE